LCNSFLPTLFAIVKFCANANSHIKLSVDSTIGGKIYDKLAVFFGSYFLPPIAIETISFGANPAPK
jgi:hypothetical protein